MNQAFVLLVISGSIALAIAHFLGRKRQIGFGWSLFFCIFLSPLIGFIVVMLSRKYYDENPQSSKTKKIIGWILIVLFSLSVLGGLISLGSGTADGSTLNALFLAIGFTGLGYYLTELGDGKNFNIDALTRTED